MVNFYVYSFSIAAIPLLLGVLLIWLGKSCGRKQMLKMPNISSAIQDAPHCV